MITEYLFGWWAQRVQRKIVRSETFTKQKISKNRSTITFFIYARKMVSHQLHSLVISSTVCVLFILF